MNKNDNLKPNLKQYRYLFENISSGQPKWRIAINIRLSKKDKESMSIENQIKRVARHIRKELEDYIIYDIYIDDGKTGTDFDRKDYMRMENDIDNKFVNCIIFKDLTRYARNMADGLKGLEDFVFKTKVRFIALGEPFVDTHLEPKAISSKRVQDALAAAEDHARATSLKVREVQEMYREDGKPTGGFPPYGFLKNPDGKEFIVDPIASEVIKQIFQWYKEGHSPVKIAKMLNEKGVPNPTAYKKSIGLNYYNPHAQNNSGLWYNTVVNKILDNENHIGSAVQGKTSSFDHIRHKQEQIPKENHVVVQNAHDRIILDEDFETVQAIRKQRTRVTKSGTVHPLANLLFCANCNHAMHKNSNGNYKYFVCNASKKLGVDFCPARGVIQYDLLIDIVLKTIQMQIKFLINMQALIAKINSNTKVKKISPRLEKLIELSKSGIERDQHILDESYYDWKRNAISEEQYSRIQEDIESKIESKRKNLSYYVNQKLQLEYGINETDEYFKKFLQYQNIETLDREMALSLIEKVLVYPDKQVEVCFKYNDIFLMIVDYINENSKDLPKKLVKKISNILN